MNYGTLQALWPCGSFFCFTRLGYAHEAGGDDILVKYYKTSLFTAVVDNESRI